MNEKNSLLERYSPKLDREKVNKITAQMSEVIQPYMCAEGVQKRGYALLSRTLYNRTWGCGVPGTAPIIVTCGDKSRKWQLSSGGMLHDDDDDDDKYNKWTDRLLDLRCTLPMTVCPCFTNSGVCSRHRTWYQCVSGCVGDVDNQTVVLISITANSSYFCFQFFCFWFIIFLSWIIRLSFSSLFFLVCLFTNCQFISVC